MKLIFSLLLVYLAKSAQSLPPQRFLIEFAVKHGRQDVIIHEPQGLTQQFKNWIIGYYSLGKRFDCS